jgi:hypothetical protein
LLATAIEDHFFFSESANCSSIAGEHYNVKLCFGARIFLQHDILNSSAPERPFTRLFLDFHAFFMLLARLQISPFSGACHE